MPRNPKRKVADDDLVYAGKLLRRIFSALQENIDKVSRKGNGSDAYEKCHLAMREILEVLAITESTYADGYVERPGSTRSMKVLEWISSIQHVDKLGEAIDWYRRIFEVDPAAESDMFAEFQVGGGAFCLSLDSNRVPNENMQYSIFRVDDLASMASRLVWAGAKILGVNDIGDGHSLIVVEDPFGNTVGFLGPGDLESTGIFGK